MDYYKRPKRRAFAGLRWKPPKWSLFMAFIVVGGIAAAFIESATSQHIQDLNTPPILYVPDRNWRISETEQVGQIIARVRAEDAENGELVFGLEPHFHSNYANPNDEDGNGDGSDASGLTKDKLPFRIDPVDGVVYLNESLLGRAGENFFLYITVSDGQLTAKNEIFVNILGRKSSNSRPPPSITNVVQNISQILPAFDTLPGVQSIRNQLPNRRPSNSLPPGFGMNPSIYTPPRPSLGTVDVGGGSIGYPAVLNFNPSASSNSNNNRNKNQQQPIWPTTNDADSDENDNDNSNSLEKQRQNTPATVASPTGTATATTSRTKLTPISEKKNHRQNSTATPSHGETKLSNTNDGMSNSTAAFSLKATVIPVIIAVSGVFVAVVAIFGFLYRKRLCAISKTLKKKSKEEMAKKSNQSNLSSNLTDDSRNSMVMQHWNGPTAFGNRYVPWERDQQMMQQSMATSQLSTSVANGAILPGDAATAGMGMGASIPNSNVNGGPGLNNGNGGHSLGISGGIGNGAGGSGATMMPGSGNNTQSKYDRWEFPRHRLKFFNILGEGAFGQVWRCEATDIDGTDGVTTVAVKTLKENAAEMEKNDLVSELQVMKSLEPHTNVVRLLGCCTDKDPLFVIIEYVNRGKLQTFLRNSRAERHYGNTHGKSNILTSGDLTSFMYQVAKGMDYLTSRGIIHRDLAARNILITDDHTCKVADFGFARDVITSKIYERKSEGKLPIRWMAIESLYDNIFSVKSDIWSFGILMWEIVTLGSTPYPGISASDVMRKVRDGYRLEKPEHCRRELYNIMYYCWSKDANERPTFAEIVQMLDKLLHTEMDYIELERFPDHNYYNILNLSGEKL